MGAELFEVLTASDIALMAIAALTAIMVSQAVLSVSGRVAELRGVPHLIWIAIGGICIGVALWSMDLSASLVLRGSEPRTFPVNLALVSIALPILGMCTALLFVGARRPVWLRAVGGGLVAGSAFAAMHFAGTLALNGSRSLAGDWRLTAAVVAVSVLTWSAVLWMAIRLAGDRGRYRWMWRIGTGATVIAGLVALSLASLARFGRAIEPVALSNGRLFVRLVPETVLGIAGGTLAVLALVLLGAGVDRRLRRRRAETEALRRSEDRFRSLVQASAQIVWTTAPDGHMIGEQRSWAEFTGQNASAYAGSGWFNAIHPEDRVRTARFWEETLANRRSMELEHRVRRFDGQYRDCVARLVPVLEADGSVREWVGTHTDVTDRTRMQQERDLLAEAGRVLSSALDDRETLGAVAHLLVPQIAEWCAIDVRSEDGTLRRLVGAHRDPSRAGLLREVDLPFLREQDEAEPRGVLENGESKLIRQVTRDVLDEIAPHPESARTLRQLGGNSLLWVPLTARGNVLGVLTLASLEGAEAYDLRDLALAEELARRAAVAVDNARLYSTSQSAIHARDEVLGVVSHDLRNPLGTIATASELLLELDLPAEDRRRHLQIVQRSARAANRLIRDLLDVTQSDSGQLAMDLQPTDPASIVSEACDLMLPLAEAKGQILSRRTPEGLPHINADPIRLQQVLSNLIGNAIKFVPSGGSIGVQVTADDDSVLFSVSDTGPGIPAEELPRLFDRHWRASKTAHLGAGLGLAISKGIVDAHGGRIWAESEPGSGTTFNFVVPVASATGAAPDPAGGGMAERSPPALPDPTPSSGLSFLGK